MPMSPLFFDPSQLLGVGWKKGSVGHMWVKKQNRGLFRANPDRAAPSTRQRKTRPRKKLSDPGGKAAKGKQRGGGRVKVPWRTEWGGGGQLVVCAKGVEDETKHNGGRREKKERESRKQLQK